MKTEAALKMIVRPGRSAFPDGHFYSPVVDVDDVARHAEQIWRGSPDVAGIDLNPASHRQILEEAFPRHISDYDYPDTLPDDESLTSFYSGNSQFGWLDSRLLFVLLREWAPKQIIEVGSGYSSLLIADVNHRFLSGASELTCIEPYPRAFLRKQLPGLDRLVEKKVQDVDPEEFGRLERGDVLFIDSSHVSKTGSDVNFLVFEVLPRLAPGVRIHFHDIFLPHDYPAEWVLAERRSWNEQYLLRALLMYSSVHRVLFGSYHAATAFPDLVRRALARPDGAAFGGGSFWIETGAS